MTQLDVHPDDLLHKARRQLALSMDERLFLGEHLRDCAVCRLIRDAGRAFDSEAAAGAPAETQALVERTMRRLGSSTRRSRPRRLAAGAMTLAVMVGGVAFAGYWGSRHAPPAIEAVTSWPHGAGSWPGDLAEAPAPAEAAPPAEAPPPSVAPGPPADPPGPPAAAPVPATGAPAPDTGAPHLRAASRRLARMAETPAQLFAAANRARREGDVAAADKAYAELWARFRASREAIAARAICGQWMLDRGQPRAAIALFRQYLVDAPAGDLEEDVLVGLAEAHERSGGSPAAIGAWRRLLSEHPTSVHADRAQQSLRRLDPGTGP
jgi:TolA-binding protein